MSGIVVLFVLALTNLAWGNIEVSRLNVSKRLEVVLIHGDESAKLNHYQAYQFCKNLTTYLNISVSKESPFYSDLLSIHDHNLVTEKLMPFVLPKIGETFWIGGSLRMVPAHHRSRTYLTWTDRSPFTFQNFHPHLELLHHARVGERFCTTIGYNTGRWGVEKCGRRMYFVCELIHLGIAPEMPPQEKELKPSFVTEPK